MRALNTTLLILLVAGVVLAHGGEDHSHEAAETPALETGQTLLKLGRTSEVEVLVKYQAPRPGEETQMKVFVTDLTTNTPVEGLQVDLEFVQARAAQTSDYTSSGIVTADALRMNTSAQPEETAGVYLATTRFPAAGQYNLTLRLKGERTSAQLLMTGIAVVDAEPVPQSRAEVATGVTAGVLVLAALALMAISRLRKMAAHA